MIELFFFAHADPGNKLLPGFGTVDIGKLGKSLNANADAILLKDIGFFIALDHGDISDVPELVST